MERASRSMVEGRKAGLMLSGICVAALTAVSVILPPAPARAEDGIACIAIYPCDDDGYLLPDYEDSSNPCYSYFLSQCPLGRHPEEVRQSCDVVLDNLADQYQDVSQKLIRAEARIKKLRVRARARAGRAS